MEPIEPLLTTDDVANFLRVDVVTVRRLVSRNEIGAYRIGNEFRFSMDDVRAYLERQHMPARAGMQEVAVRKMLVTEQEQGFLQQFKFSLLGGKPGVPSARAQSGLLGRFTRRAKQVLGNAQEEARGFDHPYVGTEHLLLALVRDDEGMAGQILRARGIELDPARQAVQLIVGRGEAGAEHGDLELTASAKKVIEYAVEEGRKLNHEYVGTEHLLLGLIRKGEGVAASVLEALGTDLQSLHDDVLAAIRRGPVQAEAKQARISDIDVERGLLELLVRKRPRKAGLLSKLTKLARSGLNASVQQARMLDKPHIGTEHILLGLLSIENGLAANVLSTLGVSYGAAREAAATMVSNEVVERQPPPDETPMTTATQRMIEGAFDEARQLGHSYIGTEHLVLGMLRDESSAGCGVLKLLKVDVERLRAELSKPPEASDE